MKKSSLKKQSDGKELKGYLNLLHENRQFRAAANTLLDAVRESDRREGCGDRTAEENEAIRKLDELVNRK